jgi:hypothetical protein
MRHCLSVPPAIERPTLPLSAERSIGVTSFTSSKLVHAEPEPTAYRAVLVLDEVAHSYGARLVVEISSWTVAPGQHSLILGASGSGKSTLLHLIAGLLRPSRGRVRVAEQDLGGLAPAELDAFRGRIIALSNAMQERRYDLAVMRTLGASRRQLFTQPLLEALILAGAGALLGILLGHLVAEFAGRLVPEARNMGLTGLTWLPEEVYVLALALVVGLLSALLPAIQAYRTDIAAVLASRA